MSFYLSEEFFYKYIPMAEREMMEAIPAEEVLNHSFSGRFFRKMNALLKYERRGSFARFAARLGRVVAAVIVVVFLLNTALVIGVKAYREKFFEIVKTVTEEFTSFFVVVNDESATDELVPIEFSYIPDGFQLVEQYNSVVDIITIYRNENGEEICYTQSRMVDSEMHIDTEDAAVETLKIVDCEVFSVVENSTIQLHWFDGIYEFYIISNTDYETVVALVEDLIKQ